MTNVSILLSRFEARLDDTVPVCEATRFEMSCTLQLLCAARQRALVCDVPRDVARLICKRVWSENEQRNKSLKEDYFLLVRESPFVFLSHTNAGEQVQEVERAVRWLAGLVGGKDEALRQISPPL